MSDPRPRSAAEESSLGELVSDVTRDLSTLMRQEIALARAELKQEARKTAGATGAVGAAALAGWFAVLFLSLALWGALSRVTAPDWAAVVVASIWVVASTLLFAAGRVRFRRINPRPERTVHTLGNVPDALRGRRGGTS